MLLQSLSMTSSEFQALLELLTLLVLNWRTGTLMVCLVLAACIDYRSHRIPNWLVGWGGLLGVVLSWLFPPFHQTSAWWPVQGLVMGLALFLPFYLLGLMGAGDVKLMAMVGAFIGPGHVLWATLYTLIAGGLLALVWVLVQGTAGRLVRNLSALFQLSFISLAQSDKPTLQVSAAASAGKLPYAMAIAIGTLTFLVRHQLGFD